MLFALYDFLAYCLYSISRFSGGSALLCAAFSEKPAVLLCRESNFCNEKEKMPCKKHMFWIPMS